MKRRRKLFIIMAAVFVVAVAAVVFWPREREPEYQGKKLSEWLMAYHYPVESVEPSSLRAADAVRAIGTNAVPFLMKWVNREIPAWKWKLAFALSQSKVARSMGNPGLRWNFATSYAQHCNMALKGFEILGPEARAAIPDLVLMMRDTNEVRGFLAFGAITAMRKESIPVLLDLLTNHQCYAGLPGVRASWAVRGFSRLRSDGRSAAPELLRIARISDDGRIREAATEALHYVAPDLRAHGMRIKRLTESVTNALMAVPPDVLTNGVSGH